ncbi:MAG: hypothetical protein CL988_04240, partial [Euryarchaeota archaeon]|nr:hypothetical protein [Euryarchaeota archaeon]
INEEDGHTVWDSTNDNPIIEVTMKVKGNYQQTNIVFAEGDPAKFGFKLGEDARLELPIDESSWSEKFQAGIDDSMGEEDTPGFTLVVASAAIAMAVFVNVGKDEQDEA